MHPSDRARQPGYSLSQGQCPAGSGKTLISAMLVDDALAKPENKGKKVVFLAPTINLVEQVLSNC